MYIVCTCIETDRITIPYSGKFSLFGSRAVSRNFPNLQCQETTPTNSFAREIPLRGSLSQFCSDLEKRKICTSCISRKFPPVR